jgi:hypothetical protein
LSGSIRKRCVSNCDARQIPFEREGSVFVRHRDVPIAGQRGDLIAADCLIVELQAVTRIDESGPEADRRLTTLRLRVLCALYG